jgi:hypothetical protein
MDSFLFFVIVPISAQQPVFKEGSVYFISLSRSPDIWANERSSMMNQVDIVRTSDISRKIKVY